MKWYETQTKASEDNFLRAPSKNDLHWAGFEMAIQVHFQIKTPPAIEHFQYTSLKGAHNSQPF